MQVTPGQTVAKPATENIRLELEAVLDSPEFRGSHRGQILLRYLVTNALDGGVERLKERTIGIELFHREVSYDTGQDAIVRVAANDIRKRLAAHYQHTDRASSGSGVRISLAPGSYIPDFEIQETVSPDAINEGLPLPPVPPQKAGNRISAWAPWIVAAGLAAFCAFLVSQNSALRSATTGPARFAILPWSQLAAPGASVALVAADDNFGFYKTLFSADPSLTFYTGQPWLEEIANRLPFLPDLSRIPVTSIADASIAARVGSVLQRCGSSISVRSPRTVQIGDFKSDRSVILLGSAYANPWVGLWNDRLNFRIEYDPVARKQVCKNASPRPGESPVYEGTAHTPMPGLAYAIISLVPNLSRDGFVLIIAGTNMEGTEAAGEFVTDLPRLAAALRSCGIDPAAKVERLELLMRLDHMRAECTRSEIIAHRVTR
jgi:hypothetical protein